MKRFIIISFIFLALLIPAVSAELKLYNCHEDNELVFYADIDVDYLPFGDIYTVNATFIAVTRDDIDWEVRGNVWTGDSVNTSDKLQALIDTNDQYPKEYDKTETYFDDALYLNTRLYDNKTLNKGYYGAVIALVYSGIVYREVGIWIHIGSIIITKIYNTTDYLEPNANGAITAWTISDPGATGYTHWQAAKYADGGTGGGAMVYQGAGDLEILQLDNLSFTSYGDNVSIHNITLYLRAWNDGTVPFNYRYGNGTYQTIQYAQSCASVVPAEYVDKITLDTPLDSQWWNSTFVNFTATDNSLCVDRVRFKLDTVDTSQIESVSSAVVQSSSDHDRNLWIDPMLDFYDTVNEILLFISENYEIVLAILSSGIVATVVKAVKDYKAKRSQNNYKRRLNKFLKRFKQRKRKPFSF